MIYITELKKPKKISGITSFSITFDFNPYVVEAIKSLPVAYYHKADYSWEIPADTLAQALDTLTYLDNIKLSLLPDEPDAPGLAPLTQAEIDHFRIKPFAHQIEAINFGLSKSNGKWLLLDSMGLGKTNEIIWYAETLKNRGIIDHALIICGVDSLRQNWKNEIRKFSNYDCLVLGEKISKKGNISYATMPERAIQLKGEIKEFFVIVNIATIRSDKIVEAFVKSKTKFGLIALDEAHKVATKTSNQGANLLKLKSDFKIAATGTLITNNPISAYVPLSWTENDSATLTVYKSQYCNFGGFNNSQIVGYKNLDTLKEEINSCMIRRTLDQVRESMPPKNVQYELVEMDTDQQKFYNAIKEGVKEEADKVELKSSNLLALTTRLRQATSAPSVLTSQDVMSCKVERCVELVEELLEQKEKVVIMSVFKEPVYVLAKMLEQYNPLIGTGDIPDAVVSGNIEKFQTDPDVKILICTHSKCGTGVTMNAASYCIMLDTPWTYASFSQSADRIWRITNTRPAFITVLACKDTIDERVLQILETKKDLADYVVDGIENNLSSSLKDEMLSIIREL